MYFIVCILDRNPILSLFFFIHLFRLKLQKLGP